MSIPPSASEALVYNINLLPYFFYYCSIICMVGGLFCLSLPPALIWRRVRIQNIISYLHVALDTALENKIFVHFGLCTYRMGDV